MVEVPDEESVNKYMKNLQDVVKGDHVDLIQRWATSMGVPRMFPSVREGQKSQGEMDKD